MSGEPRYRCPNNGRWVSEGDCMYCENPPNEDTNECWEYDVIIHSNGKIDARWDNKGRDKRKHTAAIEPLLRRE